MKKILLNIAVLMFLSGSISVIAQKNTIKFKKRYHQYARLLRYRQRITYL